VPQTAAAIASAIDEILADRTLATSMGAAGRRLVEENYSWHAIGHAMAGHYLNIAPTAARGFSRAITA
jgi:glycosyltransferase involved in cell wall biosynthesis